MNHFRLVMKRYQFNEHGLRKEDVNRVDRQNFASAQRLLSNKVADCLEKVLNGEGELLNKYSCV